MYVKGYPAKESAQLQLPLTLDRYDLKLKSHTFSGLALSTQICTEIILRFPEFTVPSPI